MPSAPSRSLRHTVGLLLFVGAASVGLACAHGGGGGNPSSANAAGAGGAAADASLSPAASASADPGIPGTFEDVVTRQRVVLARTCWEPEMAVTRATRARAEVGVTTADGRVVRVEIKGVTPGLAGCLESNVRRWQVPRTGPNTHSFVLSFVGQG